MSCNDDFPLSNLSVFNEWVSDAFFSKICSKEVMLHTHFPNKSHLSSTAIFLWQKVVSEERFSCTFEHTQCGKCIIIAPTFHQIYTVGEWIYNYLQIYSSGKTWQKKKYIYISIQNPFVLIPFPFTVDPKKCKKLSGCHKEREERYMFLKLWVCAFVNASNIKSLDHYEYLASNWYYSWQHHPWITP